MRIRDIRCPSCGARLHIDEDIMFCQYCGSELEVVEKKQITINRNSYSRYTNDADVIRAQKEYDVAMSDEKQQNKKRITTIVTLLIIFILLPVLTLGSCSIYNSRQRNLGKIQVGCYSDELEGESYHTAVEQLKASGFTNIELVDLNDDGWFNQRKDEVKSVSIGGKTNFNPKKWFYTDEKVVISYY